MPRSIQRIHNSPKTKKDRLSDIITSFVGSWSFIIFQTFFFIFWITLNFIGIEQKWDPYPFVFLNLVIALETVYTSPLILMSQNRQENRDRARDDADYEADVASEQNTEKIIEKIDQLSKDIQILKNQIPKTCLSSNINNFGINKLKKQPQK